VEVDKYGRKGGRGKKEDLKRFYHLEGEDDEDDEEGDQASDDDEESEEEEEVFVAPTSKKNKNKKETNKKKKKKQLSEEEEDSSESEEENLSDMEGEDLLARARGEIDVSSSEEETDDETDEEVEVEDEKIDQMADDERTSVIGAFNMDWDQVDSTDILAVLQSFVPAAGAIESVSVHATKEGAALLELERTRGPQGLFEEQDEEDEVER